MSRERDNKLYMLNWNSWFINRELLVGKDKLNNCVKFSSYEINFFQINVPLQKLGGMNLKLLLIYPWIRGGATSQ